MVVVFAFFLGTAVTRSTASPAQFNTQALNVPAQTITDMERAFADIYTRVSPSVVSINVAGDRQGFTFAGSGTGFVIDQQGHIVTNDHVVEGASDIEVNFFDGTIARGEVVGQDRDSDLAVVHVDLPAEQLHPVSFADSSQLFIGETTLAIGSPFGQRWTLTSGIISALDRSIEGLGSFSIGGVIQTDAAINPGNSGGPLLNMQGQVIGVNSQIATESGSGSGVGFAIPSNLVQRVAGELIQNGRVNYSFLGITGGEMSLRAIEQLNLPNNLRGVLIQDVAQGGPAEQGGIQPRDVITQVDGVPVNGMSELIAYLATNTTPGQAVNLTVWRNGQLFSASVTLRARP